MEKFIIANDTPVRYADSGKGTQAVLLLHGYLESLEVWDDFAGELGKNFRVIRPDLPGHGFSQYQDREVITMEYMADTVADVLRQADVPKCTLVGHSMGGYVVLALAERHPDLVEGLVLFHSSPNGDTPEKAENRRREMELVEAGKKELLSRVNPGKGFADQNLRRCAETIEELAEQVMLTDDQAIVAMLKGMSERPDRNAMMRSLAVPQLMIFGRHDNFIPVEGAEKMIENQPQARHAWLENSGHMGFVEQPKESLQILTGLLAEIPRIA